MSLLKKLAGETAIYGVSSILGRAMNFLLVSIHTRIFLEDEYGISQKLYAYVGIILVLLTYRMETSFFRFGTPEADRERSFATAMMSLLATTAGFLALGFFFSQPLADWLKIPDRSYLVVFIALILVMDALLEIPFARLRLEHKAKKFVTLKMAGILINIALTLFFLLLLPKLPGGFLGIKYSPSFGIGYIFIANVLASGVTLLFMLPTMLRIKASFDSALWKSMVKYAAPLVVVGLAGIADETLDRILQEELLPYSHKENLAQMGIYAACYKLTVILALFTQAFRYAAEPFIFAHAKNKDAPELYGQVAKYFTLAGALGMLFVLLYLDLFALLLGESYRGAINAVPVLLLASLCLGIYYNFSTWYRLTDRTIWGVYISLFGLAVTILFNVWWIPIFGYMGSAWAKLLCYGGMMAAGWYFGQRYFPVNYPLGRMASYVGLALGLYLLSEIFQKTIAAGHWLVWVFNTLLLGIFLFIAWRLERGSLKSIH
ncbi:MAG: polysaccharide biosynthesis C-terminal domain-containing protein [Bacteroidota bacterium]